VTKIPINMSLTLASSLAVFGAQFIVHKRYGSDQYLDLILYPLRSWSKIKINIILARYDLESQYLTAEFHAYLFTNIWLGCGA